MASSEGSSRFRTGGREYEVVAAVPMKHVQDSRRLRAGLNFLRVACGAEHSEGCALPANCLMLCVGVDMVEITLPTCMVLVHHDNSEILDQYKYKLRLIGFYRGALSLYSAPA